MVVKRRSHELSLILLQLPAAVASCFALMRAFWFWTFVVGNQFWASIIQMDLLRFRYYCFFCITYPKHWFFIFLWTDCLQVLTTLDSSYLQDHKSDYYHTLSGRFEYKCILYYSRTELASLGNKWREAKDQCGIYGMYKPLNSTVQYRYVK